jgi:ubiquinone/menaquinone biosynthesis C-methylase UbiE
MKRIENKMNLSVWNKLSKKYDHIWLQKYSLIPTRKKVLELVEQLLEGKVSCSLFDCGCGTGQLLSELSQRFPQVKLYGMDAAGQMINKAKEKNTAAIFSVGDICETQIKDFIAENSIDIITCCHSFPYYLDKNHALNNFYKILKPGGSIIFVQGSVNNLYDKLVMWFVEKTASKADYLSKNQMCELLLERFKVIDAFTIKERFFMASICGFVAGKKL